MNAGQTSVEPLELPRRNSNTYGDGDIPEVDLLETINAILSIPEECPGRGMESWP